jgi:hypothetical protein
MLASTIHQSRARFDTTNYLQIGRYRNHLRGVCMP